MAATTREDRFRVMGSNAHLVVVDGADDLLRYARARLAELEARWSRFLPDSEISTLNRAGGAPVAVSADTLLLVERALEARALTDGRFDPTLLHDLEGLGYDRSFEHLRPAVRDAAEPVPQASRQRPDAPVHVDRGARTVRLDPTVGFDPGGLGKGLAADVVVRELIERGAAGASVNLGGDVRVEGRAPTEHGWVIDLEDPFDRDRALGRCALYSGAVATSSRRARTWEQDGEARHHLLDPATGRPVGRGLVSVSIVAGEAWIAEALAKAVFVAGAEDGPDVARAAGVGAALVSDDGELHLVDVPIAVAAR